MADIGEKARATLSILDLDSPDKRRELAIRVVKAGVAAGTLKLASHIADTLSQPKEGQERTLPRQLGAVTMAAVTSSVAGFVADRLTAGPAPEAPSPSDGAEIAIAEPIDTPGEPTE